MVILPFRKQKMSTNGIKPSLTQEELERGKQLQRALKKSTQNTIKYTSLFEDGLMHITGREFSRTYALGDANYITASDDEKSDIIDYYADALNVLDSDNTYQLTVINRPLPDNAVEQISYDRVNDGFNDYRDEYNKIIKDRFDKEQNNFEVKKFVTVSTIAEDRKMAYRRLNDVENNFTAQFQAVDVDFKVLNGSERLNIFSDILRGNPYLNLDYRDLIRSGLGTKSFIAPGSIWFQPKMMKIDNQFGRVMFVRNYPNFLNDRLIKSLVDVGIELVINVLARPYDVGESLKKINNAEAAIKMDMVKSQKAGARDGISQELATGGVAAELAEEAEVWKSEIQDNDQKIYSGIFTVFFKADSEEELEDFTSRVKAAVRKHGAEFDVAFYQQENGLNSTLPIGIPFLEVKQNYMRDMTTSNIVTQVPFTNVDLQSKSPWAVYYGQNQLSHNSITLDRQRDLNTPSGVILGSSGSGKSVTVKSMEVIPTLLKNIYDRVIIVDPEDEYSDIGREFGAQMIDIYPGSQTHLNLLDLPDMDKLDAEDGDPIAQKSSLLIGFFENVLTEVTDAQVSIIDRVTHLTYERFQDKGRMPTLKDWHDIMLDQPEQEARDMAIASETYAKGSQDIFSYETNVDINDRFVIFNLKKLDGKLKPFALMVIQDYIWNMVVNNQGKFTTRIYFDEMQNQFQTDNQALFFTNLYARVRKYGAIPTGITQNVETLLDRTEGRKLLNNSEFVVLLKQKGSDARELAAMYELTESQLRYVTKPKAKGTGLIIAGGTVVPFENPIPSTTKLFKLIATDAYSEAGA